LPNLAWSEREKVERTLAEWGSQEGLKKCWVYLYEFCMCFCILF